MKTTTVPFGTTKPVMVVFVDPNILGVIDHPAPEKGPEGYLLIRHGLNPLPKEGDKGIITFTEGGPAGGHWKFTHENSR